MGIVCVRSDPSLFHHRVKKKVWLKAARTGARNVGIGTLRCGPSYAQRCCQASITLTHSFQ